MYAIRSYYDRFQPGVERQVLDAGQDKDCTDKDIGQPCSELAHVCLELAVFSGGDFTGPIFVPGGLRAEVPDGLGQEETLLGSGDNESGSNQAADEAGEFHAEEEGGSGVRITSYNVCYTKLLRELIPYSIRMKKP